MYCPEKSLNFTVFYRTLPGALDLTRYKIVVPLFGAAYSHNNFILIFLNTNLSLSWLRIWDLRLSIWQEKESINRVRMGLKNLSPVITVITRQAS